MKMLAHEIKDSQQDVVETKGRKKKQKGIGFIISEGLFADMIREIKTALDVVFFHQSKKLTMVQALCGVYIISRAETIQVRTFFDGINDATLSPKHVLCKKLTEVFLQYLESNPPVTMETKEDDPAALFFAKIVCDYLKTIHIILHEDTYQRERKDRLKAFIEDWGIDGK